MRVGVNTLFLIPGGVGGTETYLCQTLAAIAQHHADIGLVLFTNSENDPFLKQRFAEVPSIEFINLGWRSSKTDCPVTARMASTVACHPSSMRANTFSASTLSSTVALTGLAPSLPASAAASAAPAATRASCHIRDGRSTSDWARS